MEYKLLKIEELELGTRVRLVMNDQGYSVDERNPAIDTAWECAGTITEVYLEEVVVEWDNGFTNVYVDGDLIRENEGGCVSIW